MRIDGQIIETDGTGLSPSVLLEKSISRNDASGLGAVVWVARPPRDQPNPGMMGRASVDKTKDRTITLSY
jgi:hypothetical protein